MDSILWRWIFRTEENVEMGCLGRDNFVCKHLWMKLFTLSVWLLKWERGYMVHCMVFPCWRMHLYLTRMYFWTEGDAVCTLHPSQYLSRRNLCRIPSQSIRDYIHWNACHAYNHPFTNTIWNVNPSQSIRNYIHSNAYRAYHHLFHHPPQNIYHTFIQ